MAANTPTGTTTPTRPEQLQLFDAEAYVEAIRRDIGAWADAWSRELTVTVTAVVWRMMCRGPGKPAPGAAAVGLLLLLSMSGRGATTMRSPHVARALGMDPGRVRHHLARLRRDGIIETAGAGRWQTHTPGPMIRLALAGVPEFYRAPQRARYEPSTAPPKGRASENQRKSYHHHDDAAHESEPQALPWVTDTPCPTCETGRLARKPDGELDAVCKACRRRQLDNAQRPPPAPPRPTHCACGALLPLTATGEPMPSCHECATEGRGDADRRQ